jgi:hypothetical protein
VRLEIPHTDGRMLAFTAQYDGNAAKPNPLGADLELRGTKGTMYIMGNRWEVVPEAVSETPSFARSPVDRAGERTHRPVKKLAIQPKKSEGGASDSTIAHARNFLDCIKSRDKCNADILTGHLSTSATLLGNIAHKTKSYLQWDGKAERFTNHDARIFCGYCRFLFGSNLGRGRTSQCRQKQRCSPLRPAKNDRPGGQRARHGS